MNDQNKIELKITLVSGSGMTLRSLDTLRSDLFDYLQKETSPETATISQPLASRSLDPVVIGTIGLVVLPVVLEKIGDLIIKWAELRKDCSATIKRPIKGGSVVFTYDPKTTSAESLRDWLRTVTDATKS